MTSRVFLATAFVLDESHYPNVRNSLQHRYDTYLKLAWTMFRSAQINSHLDPECLFFIWPPPEESTISFFNSQDVEIMSPAFLFRPPPGFMPSFGGSLYLLDAICALATIVSNEDWVIIADPDCYFSSGLDHTLKVVDMKSLLAYKCNYAESHFVNGCTISDLRSIFAEMSGNECSSFSYFGGEFYLLRGNLLKNLASALPAVWRETKRRYDNGQNKLCTEEHILNYIFWSHKYAVINAEELGVVKRMWTAIRFRNIMQSDQNLKVWHLPAEKDFGFPEVYKLLQDPKFLCLPPRKRQERIAVALSVKGWSKRVIAAKIYAAYRALFGYRGSWRRLSFRRAVG